MSLEVRQRRSTRMSTNAAPRLEESTSKVAVTSSPVLYPSQGVSRLNFDQSEMLSIPSKVIPHLLELSQRAGPVKKWDVATTVMFVRAMGWGKYASKFEEHSIDGSVLLTLCEQDLLTHLGITILGDARRMAELFSKIRAGRSSKLKTYAHGYSKLDDISVFSNLFKLVLAFGIAFLVALATSVTMAVVHDRTPDIDKYKPLPDIMLDMIPLMPAAFEMGERIILLLFICFGCICVLHRFRTIILRRFFLIGSLVFSLRCVTMYVTALSVPGTHIKCAQITGDTMEGTIRRGFEILWGGGLALNGVRSCGDYMFSGHTSFLTVLTHFINEYSPHDWRGLHTLATLLNIAGMFAILAAHEHYTIDVIMAYYISSRLFDQYHSLAAVGINHPRSTWMTSWLFGIPLFSYFEEYTTGTIPNHYEWPWVSISKWIRMRQEHRKINNIFL